MPRVTHNSNENVAYSNYTTNYTTNSLYFSDLNFVPNSLSFSTFNTPWILKIDNDGKISFNTKDYPNLTMDERAKQFLKAPPVITHIEEKQFIFNFD